MIPKTIHYCWFGRGEKPKLARKCIASWKRFCPDYQIIEWNEDNFDLHQHPYLQWCYAQKKWAFLSDFARLLILSAYGGIYLDTDVEIIRPIDDLLKFDAFFGFENRENIASGLGFGCVPNHPAVKAMADMYRNRKPNEAGDFTLKGCPLLNTEALISYGLVPNGQRQTVLGAEILPADFLNPYDDPTGRLRKTANTYSIHWYGKSWLSPNAILKSRMMKPLHRIFGKDFILFRIMRKKK